MIRCPSSGQPCHHEVCTTWPCEPGAMAALDKTPRRPDPVSEPDTDPVTGPDNLGTDEASPSFQIDDDEEPEFTSD